MSSEILLVLISLGSQDVFEIAIDERQTEYFSTHPEMFIPHHHEQNKISKAYVSFNLISFNDIVILSI